MKAGMAVYDTHAHLGAARHSGRRMDSKTLQKRDILWNTAASLFDSPPEGPESNSG